MRWQNQRIGDCVVRRDIVDVAGEEYIRLKSILQYRTLKSVPFRALANNEELKVQTGVQLAEDGDRIDEIPLAFLAREPTDSKEYSLAINDLKPLS
ncbi:MAG: hypothetical protein QOD75_1870 [Blastocatellia bacterium]|nr:hypothetical protein [Blastocatellia bacterium]